MPNFRNFEVLREKTYKFRKNYILIINLLIRSLQDWDKKETIYTPDQYRNTPFLGKEVLKLSKMTNINIKIKN